MSNEPNILLPFSVPSLVTFFLADLGMKNIVSKPSNKNKPIWKKTVSLYIHWGNIHSFIYSFNKQCSWNYTSWLGCIFLRRLHAQLGTHDWAQESDALSNEPSRHLWKYVFFCNIYLFILRVREREWAWAERARERESQVGSMLSTGLYTRSWCKGAQSHVRNIMTWVETSELLNWLSQPSTSRSM